MLAIRMSSVPLSVRKLIRNLAPSVSAGHSFNTSFLSSQLIQGLHKALLTFSLRAEELLHHARKEWSVETMHWLLDVHFDEDRCRVQSKNIQQNLNMLHKCALNIIRIHKRETQSKLPLNGIMFRALMNPHALLPLLGKT